MKYPYSVKANGKWFRPGEDVPETTETVAAPTLIPETVEEGANQPVASQIEEVQSEQTVEDAPKKPRGRRSSKD